MERLTYDFAANGQHCWQVKGADNALCKEVCRDQGDSGCKDCPIAKAFDRLAAYEETGLAPEENKNLKNGIIPDHWAELFKAECEGRLIVLPCKVGDTVYTAQRGVVSELSVNHFELYNVGIWVSWHLMSGIYGNFRMDGFPASDIGKTVFLTRAAAEAALEKEETSDG